MQMFMKWGEKGRESSPQSSPGDGDGWYPVIVADKKDYNPVTQQVIYEKSGSVIVEKILGSPEGTYWQKRRKDYPSLEDQLDAIWKGGEAMEEMRRKFMAVKAKYPK